MSTSVQRVSYELNEDLLNRAYNLMPNHNKKTVIETALIEFVQKRERKNLKDLRGIKGLCREESSLLGHCP